MSKSRAVKCTFKAILILSALSIPAQFAKADDVKASIEARNAELLAAYNRGDLVAINKLYTRDAAQLPPREHRLDGPDNIMARWKVDIDAKEPLDPLKVLEVESDGNMAFETGEFGTGPDGKSAAKYMTIRKKVDGTWRIHREIWNGNNPPPK
jgi:ketosteroid isomerase-like protein